MTTDRRWSTSLPTEVLDSIQRAVFYQRYRGLAFLKSPLDVGLYIQLVERVEPRTIIEIGAKEGGSALWFADTISARGREPHVVSVDLAPPPLIDPRITFVEGDALNLAGCELASLLPGLPRPWLVVEDSAHTFDVTGAVLEFFDAELVPGDWIVIEDGNLEFLTGEQYAAYDNGPNRAVDGFLRSTHDRYRVAPEFCDFYGYNATWNPNGWLERMG